MKKSSKIFFISIVAVIAICSLIGLKVRSSIKDLEFKDISAQPKEYRYNIIRGRNDIKGLELENIKNELENTSEVVVRGKFTGQRKVLYGCVLSEVNILNTYKGDAKSNYIYIYEPVKYALFESGSNVKGTAVSSSGYGLMKENKEYIFFLKGESVAPGFNELKKSNSSYTYVNNEFGKFPIKYDKNDYKVIKAITDKTTYNQVIDYEQVFSNEEIFDFYNKVRGIILDKYKI